MGAARTSRLTILASRQQDARQVTFKAGASPEWQAHGVLAFEGGASSGDMTSCRSLWGTNF
eukprot:236701-Pyramimonas_sp.AAC.1